ncbi:MAG: c-type cytochrome [Opitutales bacterium]|nr:c-type cytochrome [Opitutales bacterium]
MIRILRLFPNLPAFLGLMVLPWLLSSCSRIDHKQSTLDPKGIVAQNQYDLFMLSIWITIFLFCAVGGCLLFVLWKYRVKDEEDAKEIPPQTHGNPKIETTLILVSSVILVILAIPTLQGVVLFNRVPDPNDTEMLKKLKLERSTVEDAITVNVTGKRFFWVFEYPEYGIVTANELVFPASKAVRLNLRTEDVIHSFWLPKLAGKMDLMPGQENFIWFVADQKKLLFQTDKEGLKTPATIAEAMPAVHDGSLREALFKDRSFFDEFDPVGGLFYGQCAEFCGNSHAYMQFRAMAQTDADFAEWVGRFQDSQNPTKQPEPYNPEKEYATGDVVLVADPELGEGVLREWEAKGDVEKGQSPDLAEGSWGKRHDDDYEHGKQLFTVSQCNQCHAVNRTGLGEKGPNLTLFGLRTSLAAGWMRNDKESLAKWLKNSNEIKLGNLMWNGEGVNDDHPVRNLHKDDKKVDQLIAFLLGQS